MRARSSVPKYSSADMLAELRRVDALLSAGGVLSGPKYATVGTIHRFTISTRFGSWRAAIEAAGLRSPTVKGGQHRLCDVCGTSYRWDGGAKSSKSCGPTCAQVLQARSWAGRTKTNATAQAHRGRARRQFLKQHDTLVCARCGVSTGRIEVHHKDRDWSNNAITNLEPLCASCHGVEHRLRPDRGCAVCSALFRAMSAKQTTCSRQCGGVQGAATRARRVA